MASTNLSCPVADQPDYRAWLKAERQLFPARYARACEQSEKRGEYIATEKLASGSFSTVFVGRPKFFVVGEGDSAFEEAEAREAAELSARQIAAAASAEEEGAAAAAAVDRARERDRRLPIYRLEVVHKATLVHKCRRSCVNLVAALLESKRLRQALRSPFLCRLIDCFKDHCNIYLLTPDCRAGSLRQHIVLRARAQPPGAAGGGGGAGGGFGPKEVQFVAGQLVLALEYMEAQRIAHRDIRCETVQFDYAGYVCLTDFSCAKRLTEGRTCTLVGCPGNMAPEMLQFLFRYTIFDALEGYAKLCPYSGYSNSVDYWALGLVLHEMLHGRPLLAAERSQSGLHRLINEMNAMARRSRDADKLHQLQPHQHQLQPQQHQQHQQQPQQQHQLQPQQQQQLQQQQQSGKTSGQQQQLLELISGLLNVRATQRLGCGRGGVREVKQHQFFSDLDFVALHNRLVEAEYQPNPEVSMFTEAEVHYHDIGCDQFDQFGDEFHEF